jgi:hypothetical protein
MLFLPPAPCMLGIVSAHKDRLPMHTMSGCQLMRAGRPPHHPKFALVAIKGVLHGLV